MNEKAAFARLKVLSNPIPIGSELEKGDTGSPRDDGAPLSFDVKVPIIGTPPGGEHRRCNIGMRQQRIRTKSAQRHSGLFKDQSYTQFALMDDENVSRNAGIGTIGSQYDSNDASDNEWRHENFLEVPKGPLKSVSTPSIQMLMSNDQSSSKPEVQITKEEAQLIENAMKVSRQRRR